MLKPLIAVVDDDQAVLDFLELVLTEKGWRVITAQHVSGAYDMIMEAQPDLIILDIRMHHPRAGWVFLDLLRAHHQTKGTPIIVCSGDDQFLKEKANRFKAKGCVTLAKPFELQALLALIDQALMREVARGG